MATERCKCTLFECSHGEAGCSTVRPKERRFCDDCNVQRYRAKRRAMWRRKQAERKYQQRTSRSTLDEQDMWEAAKREDEAVMEGTEQTVCEPAGLQREEVGKLAKNEEEMKVDEAKQATSKAMVCETKVAELERALQMEHELRLQLCRRLREQHVQARFERKDERMRVIESSSGIHHQLSWGMIVADCRAWHTPVEAERITYQWASRACVLHGLPSSAVGEWLVNAFPYDLHLREQLRQQTGLVAWAGHLDQTGVESGRVRVLVDDFVREHAKLNVVNVVQDTDVQTSHSTGHVSLCRYYSLRSALRASSHGG